MQAISKGVLILGALDSAAMGLVALLYPSMLFRFLQIPSNSDALFLCRLLGVLFIGHAPFLILAARQPGVYGGLTLAPLIGRVLSCGVWLWLLGSTRTTADHAALLVLLAHDAVWLPIFAGCLTFLLRSTTLIR